MLRSFAPSADPDAAILILGSMPGEESLRKNQYYAFPRNAFWRIMGEIFSFDPALPYPERLECLRQNRIALWDVLAACERKGSLDSAIAEPEPNPIPGLLARCRGIRRICCNGKTSGTYLRKFFPDLFSEFDIRILPSTSPAAAVFPYPEKLNRWREALKL